MATTYNNGATPKVGDAVIVLGNDYSSVLSGIVEAVLKDGSIRLNNHGVPLPSFNAIPASAAHTASTSGITAPTVISYVAPTKKKDS